MTISAKAARSMTVIVWWASTFVAAPVVRAQTGELPLTVQDAVSRALEASHRLAELAARSRGSSASVEGVRAGDRPALNLIGGYTRTNHVDEFGVPTPDGRLRVIYPDLPNNIHGRLDLQWPIYTAGRTRALIEAAEAETRAIAGDTASARADLVLEITRTYWAAVTSRENVRVIDESLARTAAHLAEARARLDAGFVPPNEVLSVEAQLESERARLVEAQTVLSQTLVALAYLVDAPDAQLTLTEPVMAPLASATSQPDAVEEAKGARPERRALVDRIDAAAARVAASEAERRPRLVLASGLDYARPNARRFPREDIWQESWDVSLNVSWSIFDSGRTESRVASATAAREALAEQLLEVERRISVEARQRLLDVQGSGARIDAASAAVRAAAEARRVVRERYAAGVATNTDVIDAETMLLAAELDRTRAIATAQIARAALTRALGR